MESLTEFGALPAVAVETVNGAGFPLTDSSLMAVTSNVTVCVAESAA